VSIVSVPPDGREIVYALPLGALKDISLRSVTEARALKVTLEARKETEPACPIAKSPVSNDVPIIRSSDMRLLMDDESILKTEKPCIGVSFSQIALVSRIGATVICVE
jgi:hypothetical protein